MNRLTAVVGNGGRLPLFFFLLLFFYCRNIKEKKMETKNKRRKIKGEKEKHKTKKYYVKIRKDVGVIRVM